MRPETLEVNSEQPIVNEQVDERTEPCPNCTKFIYKNELCSCQKTETPKWMHDIKKEIPLSERTY